MARDITRAYGLPDSVLALGIDDDALIVEGDFDPTVGAGQPAPLGSLFLRTDTPGVYLKDSAPDTGWTLQGTGSASFTNRQHLVFVGKHGSASPASNGRVPDDAFDTFTGAIAYANTQTPSAVNRFTILCQDSGIYSESFTVPAYVSVEARDAGVTGTLTVTDDSEVTIREVTGAVNTSAIVKTAGSTTARVKAEIIRTTGTGDTIVTQAGETGQLLIEARQVYTENGSCIVDNSTAPAGHIHVEIEDLYITGTGFGLDRDSSTGLIVGRVAHILEIGGGVGNGTAMKVDSGRVDIVAGFIDTTTAYNIAGAGTLKLLVNEISGTRVQGAGSATVDVLEADVLRWITVTDVDSPFTPRRIGYVALDTTNGPITMNLPTPPSDGDNISFQDARNTFETNNLTVDAGAGNLIDDGGAGTQTVVLNVSGTSGIFIFNGSLGRWTFSRIQEEVAFSPSNLIYVTKNGDDTIGDGSFSNPFLTVKRGVTEAETRLATTPAPTTVKVLDGVYDEVNPIDLDFLNSEHLQIQGEHEFAVTMRPTVNNQPLFTMTSGDPDMGPSINRATLDAGNLPVFKTNNQAGVVMTGPGRFVVDKVNIMNCGIGIDSGNGVSTDQEAVYDFATISGCTTGVDAKGDGIQALQVAFMRNCDVGVRGSGNVRIEIGNYATQGANFGDSPFGVGVEMNDSAVIVATSGTMSNHVTGLVANDTSESIFLTTSFAGNTNEFNQVDATADITIQGVLSKTKQLITDGSIVSLNYIDTDTGDFIVGNADATGDPGKEFRVRDVDGRIAIGDNATNENIATGTVGASRSVNLIDENGNFRIWRFTTADGEDPSVEWAKGVNASLPDGPGDTPITAIDAGTDTITIDVSGTDYNGPFDVPYGINRETLAGRAFPAGREIRINGTGSNDGDYTVSSAAYNSGPQTIDIVVTTDITVTEGAGGEVVWGGGAGRPDGVSTYVGDPGAAVAAGTGNVRWDMFLQEDDYYVIRRRTGGGGSVPDERVRIYSDHSEWLGATEYDSSNQAMILYLQSETGSPVNYLQVNNATATNGPEVSAQGTDTDIDIEMVPKGTGTVVVPAGYDANIVDQSLITKSYADGLLTGLPVLQIRRTTTLAIPVTPTWGDVTFDLTDIETDAAVIEHNNTNTEVVDIKEDGLYQVQYTVSSDDEITCRIVTDGSGGTAVIPGSQQAVGDQGDVNDVLVQNSPVLFVNLTAGDELVLQIQAQTTAEIMQAQAILTVEKAVGAKGDKGDPGSGTTINVEEDGVSVAGGPHDTLNFQAPLTASDAGGGQADIGITPKEHFHAHNNVTTQTLTATFVTAIIGTDVRSDAIYSNTNGEVTINKTGNFKVTYDISADATSGTRSIMEAVLQVNTVNVPGTFAYSYHRNTTAGEDTTSATTDIAVTSGDVVRVQIREVVGGVTTVANACRLTIEEID